MNSHLLGEALRSGDPDAVAAIYDAHADALFQYCWFMLRSRDTAQVALRDSLIMAHTHRARLAEPGLLRPWLYALARAECLRRGPSTAVPPVPATAAGPGTGSAAIPGPRGGGRADPQLIAWHAVTCLNPLEREALELATRHGLRAPDLAPVLGLTEREVEPLLARARESLRQALTGEIVARVGGDACEGSAAIVTAPDGALTTPLRERLARHADECAQCGHLRPRNVSAAKVYALFPAPQTPPELRSRVLDCLSGPDLASYRDVVAGRATDFTAAGFPAVPSATGCPAARPRRARTAHLWVGAAAATAAVLGIALTLVHLGGFSGMLPDQASRPVTGAGAPGTAWRAGAAVDGRLSRDWLIGGAAPLWAMRPAGPALGAVRLSPDAHLARRALRGIAAAQAGHLRVRPAHLNLGQAQDAVVSLGAVGGGVIWSASTSSPEVALSSYGGSLSARAEVRLVVTVAGAGPGAEPGRRAGSATITLGPGNLAVAVTWAATRFPEPSGSPSGTPGPSTGPSPSTGPPPSTGPSPSAGPTPPTGPSPSAGPASSAAVTPSGSFEVAARQGGGSGGAQAGAGPPAPPWAAPAPLLVAPADRAPPQPPGEMWAAEAPAPGYAGWGWRGPWWRHRRH